MNRMITIITIQLLLTVPPTTIYFLNRKIKLDSKI